MRCGGPTRGSGSRSVSKRITSHLASLWGPTSTLPFPIHLRPLILIKTKQLQKKMDVQRIWIYIDKIENKIDSNSLQDDDGVCVYM